MILHSSESLFSVVFGILSLAGEDGSVGKERNNTNSHEFSVDASMQKLIPELLPGQREALVEVFEIYTYIA